MRLNGSERVSLFGRFIAALVTMSISMDHITLAEGQGIKASISKLRTTTFFSNVAVLLTWNSTVPSGLLVSHRVVMQEALSVRTTEDGNEAVDDWKPETMLPQKITNQKVFLTERDHLQPGCVYRFQVVMYNRSTDVELGRSLWSAAVSLTHIGVTPPIILLAAPTSNETVYVKWKYTDQATFPVKNFSILIRSQENVSTKPRNDSAPEVTTKKSKYGKYRNLTIPIDLDANNTQSTVIRLARRAPSYQIVVLGQVWDTTTQRMKSTHKSEQFIMTEATLMDSSKYYSPQVRNTSTEMYPEESTDVPDILDVKDGSQTQLIIIISASGVVTLLILCILIIIVACKIRSSNGRDNAKSNGKRHGRNPVTMEPSEQMRMKPMDYEGMRLQFQDDPSKSSDHYHPERYHNGDYQPMKRDEHNVDVNEMSELTAVPPPFHSSLYDRPVAYSSESNNNLYQNDYSSDPLSPEYSGMLPYSGSPPQSTFFVPPTHLRTFPNGAERAYIPTPPLPNGRDPMRNHNG